jgi:4-amino-4-deoxy-L-arabinose transferase-like glycosyltransferase
MTLEGLSRSDTWRLERRIVWGVVAGAVLARTIVFLAWPHASFDSDQAVVGLMAKHLSEGRAFPLFYYGQNYLLAVQAWMAAPLFLVLGPTAFALKLPLVALNVAVGLLLVHLLERDAGLRPALAATAACVFVLAPAGLSAELVNALGVSIEPFLYVLLIWMLRARPGWLGAVLGVGFLHREFTLYGLAALVVVWLLDRSLLTRERLKTLVLAAATAAAVWLFVDALRPYSSGAGPGTTGANVYGAANNVQSLLNRVCGEPALIVDGLRPLFGWFLGVPLGLTPTDLATLTVNTTMTQGTPWLWPLFGIGCLAGLLRVAWLMRRRTAGAAPVAWAFPAYLFVTGAITALAYDAGRCGYLDARTVRYALLVVFGFVGLAAAWLQREPRRGARAGIVVVLGAWCVYSLAGHVRLLDEYVRRTPPAYRQVVADYLVSHGIPLARSDYWTGYYVTFLAREQVVVATDGVWRVLAYHEREKKSPRLAYTISREPCRDGRGVEVYPQVYWVCDPPD